MVRMQTSAHAATTELEVERTYALDPEAPPVSLVDARDGLHGVLGQAGIATVASARVLDLDATYWDTADLRLASRGVRLRRRRGGGDAGWHVKLPVPAQPGASSAAGGAADGADKAVLEVHLPLTRAARPVPRELAELVTGATLGEPLRPVARIRTRRTEHDLLDGDGRVLAVVADDRVRARRLLDAADGDGDGDGDGDDRTLQWREVEVELHGGRPELLVAVDRVLAAQGAVPATHPSKAGRVLDVAPLDARPAPLGKRPGGPEVLAAYVRAQVEAIRTLDAAVRRDAEEAVHDMRVSARRLRGALQDFRSLLERETTDPLVEELRWLGTFLSEARDSEVVLPHLREALGALPPGLRDDEAAERAEEVLTEVLEARRARGHAAALDAMRSRRYLDLLAALRRLADDPPLRPEVRGATAKALREPLRTAHRRLVRRLRATRHLTGTDRDLMAHDARKAAKRLRYACDLAAPALGRDAERLSARAKEVQEVLGLHQDSAVAQEVLREVSAALGGGPRDVAAAYCLGALAGLEAERGQRRLDDVDALLERVRGGKATRVLD